MEITEIVEKLKRSHLLLRIWFWAAVRSPCFHYCQLILIPPIEVEVSNFNSRYEFLRIQIVFNRPKLSLGIPWTICTSFGLARQKQGENIDLDIIDDIPF